MRIIFNLLITLPCLAILSCQEPQPKRGALEWPEPTTKLAAKIDLSDAGITAPAETDLACLRDSDCVVIDQGCCRGEKRLAVNKVRVVPLINSRTASCAELRGKKAAALAEEMKKKPSERARGMQRDLCYGRKPFAVEHQEVPLCVECKCTIGTPTSKSQALGNKCANAKKFLNDNHAAMIDGIQILKDKQEKSAAVNLWNNVASMVRNLEECACEKYLKELEEVVKKISPPPPAESSDEGNKSS